MLDIFKSRRIIRKFTNELVSKEDKEKIIKAGLLSPSSMNKKPVELIVIENKETIERLEKCKKLGTLSLKTSPLVIAVVADSEVSDVWVEDASIAATFIQLEVEKLGLGSTWIQMRRREAEEKDSEVSVREVLEIPERYGVLSLIAIGHKDEEKSPYEDEDLDFSKIRYEKF